MSSMSWFCVLIVAYNKISRFRDFFVNFPGNINTYSLYATCAHNTSTINNKPKIIFTLARWLSTSKKKCHLERVRFQYTTHAHDVHSPCCSRTWFPTRALYLICSRRTRAAKSPRRKRCSFSGPPPNPAVTARSPATRRLPDERLPSATHDGRCSNDGRHPSVREPCQPARDPTAHRAKR